MRYWHSLSLQWKSALLLGLGLGILFGLFAIIAAQTLRRSTDVALQEHLVHARMAAQSLDDLIRHTRLQMESTVSMPTMRAGDLQEQTAALHSIISIPGSFEALRLLDARGQLLWEESVTQGENPQPQGDLSARDDIAQVLATGATVVAQVSYHSLSNPPIAVISTPLKDPQGRLINILQGELYLPDGESQLLPLPRLSPTGLSSIVDSRGNILASSDGARGRRARSPEDIRLVSDLLSRGIPNVGIHEDTSLGDRVVAFAPLGTTGGGVLVEEREEVVLAVPQRLRSMLLIFGSSALILASLGAWLYLRRVIQPLKAMTEATAAIAQGQLDSPIVIARGDEIGELGRSLDSMRLQLLVAREEGLHWEQELEARVRLRTAQVHQLTGKIISAQEEERKRLARELHDGAAQAIATLMLHLTALEQELPQTGDMETARHLAQRAMSHSSQVLHELRRMIQDLRPAALDDIGLVAAARRHATAHLEASGIQMRFQASGEVPVLDSSVETAIFRILQEAINNATYHARAHSVAVALSFTPHLLRATVEDDGTGFDVEEARTRGGLGITGMEERADIIGGRFSLRSRPGAGTCVELEVPLGR